MNILGLRYVHNFLTGFGDVPMCDAGFTGYKHEFEPCACAIICHINFTIDFMILMIKYLRKIIKIVKSIISIKFI